MKNQTSKWIVITGCSTGIGRSLVGAMRRRGWGVIATARKIESLADLPDGEDIFRVALDVLSDESIRFAIQQCQHLRIVGLINNAGYGQVGPLEYITTQELKNQMETNVFGLHRVTNHFIPILKQNAKSGEGRIVHIASMLGRVSIPLAGAYSASKHAVVSLGETLRMELAPDIKVIVVEPGAIRTELRESATKMWGNLPERVRGSKYDRILHRYLALGKDASQRWARDPDRSADKIARAVNSAHPPRRVLIGPDAHLVLIVKKFIPLSWYEALARKIYGLMD
ncbi:MAG: SDR family oxidoreductase [Holophagaceae bacterium]